MSRKYFIIKAFPACARPTRSVTKLSAVSVSRGSPILTKKFATSTQVHVIKNGVRSRRTCTLMAAILRHNDKPKGISYELV